MNKIYLLLLAAIMPFFALSQKQPKNKMKFGKVLVEELQMTQCAIDSTADAVILGEFYSYTLENIPNIGLKLNLEVFKRIKILNTNSINDLSNFKFELYQNGSNKDRINYFKAVTYNLENGQIIETPLDKDSRFIEEDGDWQIYKYAFNNVKEGSVLEYKVNIQSDYLTDFPVYYSQASYPIVWTELYVAYPELIDMKYFITGQVPLSYSSNDRINGIISDLWIFQNVPALKQDNYSVDVKNYFSKIKYELRRIAIPGVYYKEYTNSWNEISKDLMESDHVGELIKKKDNVMDIVAAVNADTNCKTVQSKVSMAKKLINAQYQWNSANRLFPTWEFKKVIKEKSGNSADLNILLLATLKELNIPAKPVALSTRSHGMVVTENPSTKDLNYLITSFEADGKRFYVDAATDYSGINQLPEKCINGKALILDLINPVWADITAGEKYNRKVLVKVNLDESLMISGNYQSKESGYAAQKIRREIFEEGSESEYISQKKNSYANYEIADYTLKDVPNYEKPVAVSFNFNYTQPIGDMGGFYTIDPILFKDFSVNPFVKETREVNIDFIYPMILDYTYILTLPQGFTIEELTTPQKVTNPDKTISFSYNVVANANTVTFNVKFQIDRTTYAIGQYDEVKSFFELFINKQNTPLIIKRN